MTRQQQLILLSVCLAFFAGNTDITAMNLALAAVQQSLLMSVTQVQWVINAFLLGFSACLVLAGRLSDILGYKRLYLLGTLIFALTSLGGALCYTGSQVIALRALQGIGTALFWPCIQAITMRSFMDEQRGQAMGILLGVGAGLGMALGPLLGGVLVEFLSWRYIFVLNIILVIPAHFVMRFALDQDEKGSKTSIDWFGSSLLALTFTAIGYGFHRAEQLGFANHRVWVTLLIALIGLLWFILQQLIGKHPLVEFSKVLKPLFGIGVVCRMAVMYSYIAIVFLLTLFFSHVMHLTALASGVYLLPMMLWAAVASMVVGRFSHQFGNQRLLMIALVLIAVAVFLLMQQRDLHITFYTMLFPLSLLGVGIGMSFPTSNIVTLSALDKSNLGIGAGILYMLAMLAGSLGVSVSATIAKVRAWDLIQSNFLRMGIQLDATEQQNLHEAISRLQLTEYLKQHFSEKVLQGIQPSVDHVFGFSFADAGYVAIVFCLVGFSLLAIHHFVHRGVS